MNIQIQTATIDDIDAVSKLFNDYRIFYGCQSDIEGAKAFLFERFKNLDSIIYKACTEKNECVGFMQLYPSFSSVSMKKVYILNDLFVQKDFRCNGVAALLLNQAKKLGSAFNAARITLTTEVTNTQAQKVYEKNGFAQDDENKVYHFFIK